MRINLCEIIEMPGSALPFSCALDEERVASPAVLSFVRPPVAEGQITNTAGALTLTGLVECSESCLCDRCGAEFILDVSLPVEVKLAAELVDEENPDIFPLDGNWLDLSEVLETAFILGEPAQYLCQEDCKGLCDRCGKNLNDGPCGCGKEIDPRLAVLQQLLDKKEQ